MTIENLTGTPENTAALPQRSIWQALRHGNKCHCPSCGEGSLFESFLKVAPHCSICGEELYHHRADDLPPYIVITIVGHIIATLILLVEMFSDMSTVTQMILWPALTLILSLVMMRPVKGAVVGYQWALRMHGFGGKYDEEAPLRGLSHYKEQA